MMKFQFELRSKTFPSKTWNNTIDFCIDHDIFIPHEYQKVILGFLSLVGFLFSTIFSNILVNFI